MSKLLKGFITYSHENTAQKDELRKRLAVMEQQNELVTWDDGQLTPGDGALQEDILKKVADSDLFLYLVSAASLASKNCNKELAEALKQEIKVIPIILEYCDWLNHQVSGFEVLPHKGKPISKWEDESEGWQNVIDGIRKTVNKMRNQVDLPSAVSEKKLRAELEFQRGNVQLLLGQLDAAIEVYSDTIELNPHHVDVYNNRGVVFNIKGKHSKAIKDLTKAINLKPDHTSAYNNRAAAYFSKGYIDLAIEDNNKAIELEPDFAGAYNNRGLTYENKGELDKAIKDYNIAIKLNPDNALACNNRGNVYRRKKEFDCAFADYNAAIELDPYYAAAYKNRGSVYFNKGCIDLAIEDYNKAIELNLNEADVYNNRGDAYATKREFDKAFTDFSKAIELKPDYARAYYNLGKIHTIKDELDLALQSYNKAIELRPDFANAYNNRGVIYENKGEFDKAFTDYSKAIELKPDYIDAYNNRGVAYFNKGEMNLAITDYNKAIELNLDYAEVYNHRGSAYGAKGELDEAFADFRKSIELKPNNASAYYNLGKTYCIVGETDLALQSYDKAIEFRPDFANAYNNRGVIYGDKGEINKAIKDYNKAIKLKPDLASAYNNRGTVYSKRGEINLAIKDYTAAIEHQQNLMQAYYNRAEIWLRMGEWEKSRADLIFLKNSGVDIIAPFHNGYKNVETFEQRHRVKLPKDIALLLTQRRRDRYPKTRKVLDAEGNPLESPNVVNLREQLRNAGVPLGEYVKTKPAFGINTAPAEAFVVDKATRDKLIAEHSSSAGILKPFLHGQDLRRWHVDTPHQWLIFTHRGIAINDYPAILKHLEKYRESLSKRKGKQEWYELPVSIGDMERFAQPKLVCPDTYNHQTFAVDTAGYYYGKTSYLIPTEETWLCGLLNSRTVEWFYSQVSNQLTIDWLRARSGYIQQIPIPDLTSTEKALIAKLVDYLIYLQQQPTINSKDLKHARDHIMLRYFERIIDGLVYEIYLTEELHQGDKHFLQPLLDEKLPPIEDIKGDKMEMLRNIFELLYERTHLVMRNLYYLGSVKAVRIVEGKI